MLEKRWVSEETHQLRYKILAGIIIALILAIIYMYYRSMFR
jgi:hypothetical protein